MTKTIDKDTLIDLLEEDGVIKINEHATKHDCHLVTSIIPLEGKFWMVSYECSYNHGIQDDEFELQEAESHEITVKKWKIKK